MLMKLTPGFNFVNILCVSFSHESALSRFSLITAWLGIFLAKEYRHKSCRWNVDEINYRRFFFTSFTSILMRPQNIRSTEMRKSRYSLFSSSNLSSRMLWYLFAFNLFPWCKQCTISGNGTLLYAVVVVVAPVVVILKTSTQTKRAMLAWVNVINLLRASFTVIFFSLKLQTQL